MPGVVTCSCMCAVRSIVRCFAAISSLRRAHLNQVSGTVFCLVADAKMTGRRCRSSLSHVAGYNMLRTLLDGIWLAIDHNTL